MPASPSAETSTPMYASRSSSRDTLPVAVGPPLPDQVPAREGEQGDASDCEGKQRSRHPVIVPPVTGVGMRSPSRERDDSARAIGVPLPPATGGASWPLLAARIRSRMRIAGRRAQFPS